MVHSICFSGLIACVDSVILLILLMCVGIFAHLAAKGKSGDKTTGSGAAGDGKFPGKTGSGKSGSVRTGQLCMVLLRLSVTGWYSGYTMPVFEFPLQKDFRTLESPSDPGLMPNTDPCEYTPEVAGDSWSSNRGRFSSCLGLRATGAP